MIANITAGMSQHEIFYGTENRYIDITHKTGKRQENKNYQSRIGGKNFSMRPW